MIPELILPKKGIQALEIPSYVKLDMAFGLGEGATLFDKSRYCNHGTITDGSWVAGLHGYGLSFDGLTGYVDCGKPVSLDITGDQFTMLCWIYPTVIVGGVLYRAIMGRRGALGSTYIYGARDLGTLGFSLAGIWNLRKVIAVAGWTMVTGTYDGITIRLYKNDTEIDNYAITGNILSTADYDWNISRLSYPGGESYCKAIFGMSRVLGLCLTANEVASLYNATK